MILQSSRFALLGLALAASGAVPSPSAAQTAEDVGCDLCHGELELLRQHVATLEDARRLVAPSSVIAASGHTGMSCSECHSGYGEFPHPTSGATESCASCHEPAAELWDIGVHANADVEDGPADCVSCHSVHDVSAVADLAEGGAGVTAMNAACTSCHEGSALPSTDPHLDSISCATCHAPHDTRHVATVDARVAPASQPNTCGACHEDAAGAWPEDAHGLALMAADSLVLDDTRLEVEGALPTCTSCHGAHGMLVPSHERFDQEMVGQCSACHADYAETYFGTYHGKATALGSEIVATCDHCHGSHNILPASDERSTVAHVNLVETCGECHEAARPAFVEYDSHPDPTDRERNPVLFYSFWFMNILLVGVLGVFTLHTVLWWLRLYLDRRKGIVHGPGSHHE